MRASAELAIGGTWSASPPDPTGGAATVARTIETCTPYLDAALVSAPALDRVRDMGAWFPAAGVEAVVLECRLQDRSSRVDLSVRVSRAGGAIISGHNPSLRLPQACAGDAWARVRAMCAHWTDPTSATHRAVDHLWLEFDAPAASSARSANPPMPSCFVALDADVRATRDGRAIAAVAREVLAPLLDGPLTPSTWDHVARAVDALPAAAHVQYLAVMLARSEATIRVYAAELPAAAWPGYLHAVGWPGGATDVAAVLRELACHADDAMAPRIGLGHLDILHGAVLPRLGLEYTLSRSEQLRGILPDAGLLDRLVARGLCAPAKRDALRRWPGARRTRLPHTLWETAVVRRVNDIKVVIDSQGVNEAKAYLTISLHPLVKPHG